MVPTNGLSGTEIVRDAYGFAPSEGHSDGIHVAGVAKRPMDVASSVRDGTAAALKAIQDMTKD
jgi:quinone-modifying oxidoreductase subunit QmoA